MKKCDKIRGLFGAYLHDDVTSVERAAVEKHTDSCEKCAADLHSRRKVLEMLKPEPLPEEIPESVQDSFAWNVYRRIAADATKERTRQIRVRRFVLQPALAAAALATVLIVGVAQFYPDGSTLQKSTVATNETNRMEHAAKLRAEERRFFERQEMPLERESGYVVTGSVSATVSTSTSTSYFTQDAQRSDSQRQLQYANFIDYSLGEPGRALAAYRKLVDNYPGTYAAEEARRRIRAISGMEYGIQFADIDEEQRLDMGI